MDPVLKVLLLGTRCPESPLYALRGGLSKTVLPLIWRLVRKGYINSLMLEGTYVQYTGHVDVFPKPRDRNVNMMPFVLGDATTLPEDLHGYLPVIEAMCIPQAEYGTTCYLTIHESVVKEGTSQRRPGLHCEAPGEFFAHPPHVLKETYERPGWGGGWIRNTRRGGIYMVSNVSNTCALWNCAIKVPGRTYFLPDKYRTKLKEVRFEPEECEAAAIGTLGSLEHLRMTLGQKMDKPIYMQAGEVYWMTDLTPHESLPVVGKNKRRQYVRVVTSQIGGWYKEHSTENPKGIKPLCPIIEGDKFKKAKAKK